MLEVFTVGGGEYLVNVFNAVAAWSGGGGYRSLLRVVMVMGLIYALLVVAFSLNYKAWLNWFLQATLIYGCLMVPTVDVKVTDRINPSLAPATVDNVPLGLGVLASFTTQIGDYLTRTAETVFVMPSELNYSTNGLIYGARLFDATRNFTIRDAEFATNLEKHFKSCVFGDVMLNQKSLTDLAGAADLWAALGPGSEARSQEWLEKSGGTVTAYVITCRQAYDGLTAQWVPMIEAHTPMWGKEAFPKLSNALAADKLRTDVPVVNQAFTGSAGSYTDAMRQNSAITAFMRARDSMSGGTGSATIDTFAQTRADIQARNTYNSIAQQAMTWVPILNIVLTVVFFAMFPVIFPLFLMPQTGVNTLKGYGMGFFYLAAWGPLYVILHMICMNRAQAAANGMAGGGVTLGSYAGIGAVNAETATIAGFMLMSIPFLAAGLARGAMSIAGQATSMLAPAQNAAEAAAVEQTTGNYSYGNVSWANRTANMRQSDAWSMAPSYMSGASMDSWRQDDGTLINGFGSGFEKFDASGGISKLPFTPSMNSNSVREWREMASLAMRQALAYENAASEIITATHTDRTAVGTTTERTSGSETSRGRQANTSVEQFDRRTGSSSEGYEDRSSVGQSQRVSASSDTNATVSEQVSGSVGAGLGGQGSGRGARGAGGMRALPGISGSVTKSGLQQSQLQHSTGQTNSTDSSSTASSSVRDEHSNGTGASASDGTYLRGGVFSRSSSSSSVSASSEDALARARSYQESARKLEEMSQQLTRDASFAESNGLQMSTNMSQELANWYRQQQAANPGLDAPEIWATDLTRQQQAVREQMIQRWLKERRDEIYAEISPKLVEPSFLEVNRPSVSSEADVIGLYRPQGGGGRGGVAVDLGDPGAATKIIDGGRVELEGDRSSAQANRAANLQSGARVQSEVNESQDKGFFHDPHLRK
jgi:conjugal transfer mating pair stabilization protein TraG